MSGICFCGAPATTGQLCTQDLARLEANLRRTPDVLRDLDVTITGQAQQGGGGNGSGTPDVFNERASDARINLTYLLNAAARTADPTRGVSSPDKVAAVALGGVDTIARSPGVHTTVQDLRDALVEADKVRDRAEEKIAYGPCSCGVQLIAPRSRDTARCRNPECGEVWEVAQLRAFRHAAALDRITEYVGTASDIVKVLKTAGHHINHSTLRSWIRRGELTPVEGRKYAARSVLKLSQRTLT
jgi:hypothetical protein